MDRIDTSLKCRVEKWLHPAYEVLCKRPTGLSEAEAERLGVRRATAVWRIREATRSTAQAPTQPNCMNCRRPPQKTPGFRTMPLRSPSPPSPGSPTDPIVQSDKARDLIEKDEALKFH